MAREPNTMYRVNLNAVGLRRANSSSFRPERLKQIALSHKSGKAGSPAKMTG